MFVRLNFVLKLITLNLRIMSIPVNYQVDSKWVAPFAPRNIEPSIISTDRVIIKPSEIIDKSTTTFSFELPSLNNDFSDLSSIYIYVKGHLEYSNGDKLNNDLSQATLSNNALHTLWKRIDISIGQNQSLVSINDYPYLALLRTIDIYKKDSKQLLNQLFVPDIGTTVSTSVGGKKTKMNFSHSSRKFITMGSRECILHGKLLVDLASIDSYLFKNTPMKIQFFKSDPSFYVTNNPTITSPLMKDYNFVITQFEMHLDTLKINTNLSISLDNQLKLKPAVYSYTKCDMLKYNVPSNVIDFPIHNVLVGKLPIKFVISFVSQEAYRGNLNYEPMHFTLNDLEYIDITVNGSHLKKIDLKTMSTLPTERDLIDFLKVGHNLCINAESFKESCSFLCVDLNRYCHTDLGTCMGEINPVGQMSFNLSFKTSTKIPTNLLLFAYKTDYMSIDVLKQTSFDANMLKM